MTARTWIRNLFAFRLVLPVVCGPMPAPGSARKSKGERRILEFFWPGFDRKYALEVNRVSPPIDWVMLYP